MGMLDTLARFKFNRAQRDIKESEGDELEATRYKSNFIRAYDGIEVVSRGTDLIADSAAEIDINITKALPFFPQTGKTQADDSLKIGRVRLTKVHTLLNFQANTDEDINLYRRQLIMDLVLDGNCFQYWDGVELFHLPAHLMVIETGSKDKVKRYKYNGKTFFQPHEIIHTRDNASDSVFRGVSRLVSAKTTIQTLYKMLQFQANFFENNAIPGLVLTTENILNDKIKKRIIDAWVKNYNPLTGARRPMILDGGFKLNPLSQFKFGELDFENSVEKAETKLLKALGVPPILLNSGNNANLTPNLKLFYQTTVLPLVAKLVSSYERYFAYDMEPETAGVSALQPELRDQANQLTSFVNNGIITVNEARQELRMDKSTEPEADKLRIPANIAGSATDPATGGRPAQSEDGKDDEDKKPKNSDEDSK